MMVFCHHPTTYSDGPTLPSDGDLEGRMVVWPDREGIVSEIPCLDDGHPSVT